MGRLLVLLLTLICMLSFCACSVTESKGDPDKLPGKPTDSFEMDPEEEAELYKEDIAEDDEDEQDIQHIPYKFPNQYKNAVFLFEQGYPEGWRITVNENGECSQEEKLLAVVSNKNDTDSARYCIYKQGENAAVPADASLASVYALVTNPDSDLYFNKNMEVRDEFAFTNQEAIDVFVNGLEYYSATYTFTKEGIAWQGQFYLFPVDGQFFVVAYEAEVGKWEQFQAFFMEIFEDFKPELLQADTSVG